MITLRLLMAVALGCFFLPHIQAADNLWAGVVLATNEDHVATPPRSLRRLVPAMADVFGYNTFYLLGEKSGPFDAGLAPWVIPTRDFYFQVQGVERQRSSYLVKVHLYEKNNLLLSTEAKLAHQAPLFIRGPLWGKGQIILVLEIR